MERHRGAYYVRLMVVDRALEVRRLSSEIESLRDELGRADIAISDQASGDVTVLVNDSTPISLPTFGTEYRYRAGNGLFDIMKEHFADAYANRGLALSLELNEFSESGTLKHNNLHARFPKTRTPEARDTRRETRLPSSRRAQPDR
jgi:hypothetical protein